MSPDRIEILNDIIKDYNQFTRSKLHEDIISVLGCTKSEADDLAKTHCNMVSFWACCVASGKTGRNYMEFFWLCLETDIEVKPESGKPYISKGCNREGKILVGKEFLCPAIFGFEFNPVWYENYSYVKNPSKLDPDCFYQLKIQKTDHYMACYIENGILKLSDTNNRGIGIPAIKGKRVDQAHFKWLLKI